METVLLLVKNNGRRKGEIVREKERQEFPGERRDLVIGANFSGYVG